MALSTHSRFQQLQELFERAVALEDAAERDRWVREACGADEEMEAQLRRLLASDAGLRARPEAGPAQLPRFGRYQARELIGSGGMGAVYRATREDGEVRQEVAVKVVKPLLWSAAREERFRRERQILAELEHPNIARFLDGETTADGDPYLVMEFVAGERLDLWSDRQRLSVRRRLELFLGICEAVSFAHQKLVVHRDLKPGNILVDGEGKVKLLDFGIAQTLDPEPAAGPSDLTATIVFTPQYASPEQIRGERGSVSCDVYSLGAVLFELLAGSPPFGRPGAAPADVIARVLGGEIHLPSESATAEAANARTLDSAAALRRLLRGDLDAIAAKALAKLPEARYASVEQLADDVRRYLGGFPVRAASTGAVYRARKFLRRHRAGASAAAIVLLTIVAGAAATLWQARVAERRFAQTRALARYLMFDLTQSVGALAGATPVQEDMVKHSLQYLDALSAEKSGDSLLRTEVGEGYLRLAALMGHPSQNNLGDMPTAEQMYRKAMAILEPESRDGSNRRAIVALATARLELGQVLGFNSESGEGVQLIERATGDYARMAARWPDDFEVRVRASVAYEVLALSLSRPEGYIIHRALDRSIPALRVARDHALAAGRIRPSDFRPLRQLAMTLKVMGDFVGLEDHAAAGSIYRDALAALDRIPAADRNQPMVKNARSSVLIMLGDNLRGWGDTAGARAALEQARDIRDEMSREDPKNVLLLRQRLDPYDYLLRVTSGAGRLGNYEVLDTIHAELVAQYPSNEAGRFDQAIDQAGEADLRFELGQKAAAARLAEQAYPVLKRIAAEPRALAITQSTAAAALLDARTPGFADPKLALDLAKRADAGYGSKDAETLTILARAYWANGDRQAALEAQQRALGLMAKASPVARAEAEKALARYRQDPASATARR